MAPKTKKVMKAPGKTRKPQKMERLMLDNANNTLLKDNAYDKHPCADNDSLTDLDCFWWDLVTICAIVVSSTSARCALAQKS